MKSFWGFFGARAAVVYVEKMLLFDSSPHMGAAIAFLASKAGSSGAFEM